jgi:hypothetical protein
VNNYVEKRPLDSLKACADAGYNKMPLARANFEPNEIKDLANTRRSLVRKLRR